MIEVNHTKIDDSAILNEMQYHEATSPEAAKTKAAESLIIAELLKQEACRAGCEDSVDMFVDRLLETEIQVPEVSEAECRRYFENNPGKFCSSPLVEGKHILLAANAESAEERSVALEQAKKLIEQLEQTPDCFEALAEQYSSCPSAKTGGHLGQIGKGQTVPEFERQLFKCSEGLAGSPIESRYGVHVVWVNHVEPGRALPFEAVQQKITDYLNDSARFKAVAHYIQNLVNQAEIKGFDIAQFESPLMQ